MKIGLGLALVGVFGLVGCGGSGDEAAVEAVHEGRVRVVNGSCPVMPEEEGFENPAEEGLVVEWKGVRVGMCCNDCVWEWEDEWTDEERDAYVARATAVSDASSGDGRR